MTPGRPASSRTASTLTKSCSALAPIPGHVARLEKDSSVEDLQCSWQVRHRYGFSAAIACGHSVLNPRRGKEADAAEWATVSTYGLNDRGAVCEVVLKAT